MRKKKSGFQKVRTEVCIYFIFIIMIILLFSRRQCCQIGNVSRQSQVVFDAPCWLDDRSGLTDRKDEVRSKDAAKSLIASELKKNSVSVPPLLFLLVRQATPSNKSRTPVWREFIFIILTRVCVHTHCSVRVCVCVYAFMKVTECVWS